MTSTQRPPRKAPDEEVVDLDASADAWDHLQPIDRPIELKPLYPFLLTQLSGTYIRRPFVLAPAALQASPDYTPGPDGPDGFPGIPSIPGKPFLPFRPELPDFPTPIRVRNSEDLRVDVDGWYAQNVVSGTIRSGLSRRLDWHARVTATPTGTYAGAVVYRDGDSSLLPQTHVEVSLVRRNVRTGAQGSATATFSGGGAVTVSRAFAWSTSSFHPLAFEFDTTSDSGAVTSFNIASHPNRPSDLSTETITIEKVYQRAGFAVTKSGGDSVVPVTAAGANALWSYQELNDAMATYWSAYKTVPDWAAWALFAGRSDQGTSLGGVMFDYTGSSNPQRQGCVVFANSFISNPPAGDANAAAFVQRMRFWTACHELGHTFNLLHAWDKAGYGPWVPTSDERSMFSFMNYPYNYAPGGTTAFFNQFRYSFTASELLFLRHAPERFVQQGNNDWSSQHGFSQANVVPGSVFSADLRAHRTSLRYEFLEPVTLELKLRNDGGDAVLVDEHALDLGRCTVMVQKRGGEAKRLEPFMTQCFKPSVSVLPAEGALYASVTVSSGRDGWLLAEPGDYVIQVAVHLPDQDVVSPAIAVRVLPPVSREAEILGQDVLTPEVGRVLAAGGTRRDAGEADVLREATTRLAGSAIAKHAAVALGRPLAGPGKQLVVHETAGAPAAQEVVMLGADPKAAVAQLEPALSDADAAAETFGHIAGRKRVEAYASALADAGRRKDAVKVEKDLHSCLARRGVKESVLAEVAAKAEAIAKA